MKTLTFNLQSENPALTKTGRVASFSITGSKLSIGLAFAWTDANGMAWTLGEEVKRGASIAIDASPAPTGVVLTDDQQANLQARQDLYDTFITALEPLITAQVGAALSIEPVTVQS